MGISFTKDQQRVIDTRDKNILVSAAAGSGKTAVLVERIIQMIMDDENPTDIDRLLVVTFTEAAAAQMKDKIAAAIDEKLADNPENLHLQKQSSLIYKAQISTIHKFCLSVIRNNFNKIGLDPSFRVADETELELMKEDILEEMFEEKYRVKDESFLNAVEFFDKDDDDRELKDYILKLHTFSEGYPWPFEFLDDCLSKYIITDTKDFESKDWVRFLLDYAKKVSNDAILKIEEAKSIIDKPYGPVNYEPVIEKDIETVNGILSSSTYEEYKEALDGLKWATLPTKKVEGVDDALKEAFKAKRDEYKGLFNSKKSTALKNFFNASMETEIEIVNLIRPYIETLIELVKEFSFEFENQRRKKCIISFQDMEHYALNILCTRNENGEIIPTDAARSYQEIFDEILMDEYQDCNRVQELLMWCVSSETRGKFNRFMVGDVKQSIYKFRLANPQLFIEKYNSYGTGDPDGQNTDSNIRINLKQNFRSRESVVNTVNDLFGQIMRRTLGDIEYDDDAKLVLGASFPAYSIENKEDQSDTLFMLAVNNNDSDEAREIIEARLIARKIKELMKSQIVKLEDRDEFRPLSYKDIVILVRSMTDVARGIKEVFSEEGIPLFMNTSVGFFNTTEIQSIVQLLKVLDNPIQDIPLYGTLISFFGKMSDEEVALIKTESEGNNLYEKLNNYASNNEKASDFIQFLNTFREKVHYTSVRELVTEIIDSTGYLEYVTSMAGGEQRRANVKMLISYAGDYENTTYKGLFHFVRYLREVQKVESSIGEADILDENADVVKVMTIHKSKGLEFPVVFVSGVHKKFNAEDTKGLLSIDMDYGIGTKFVDIDRRTKTDSLLRNAVNLKIKQDMISEELRVFYVALTRAKEKLIITGVCKENDIEKIKKEPVSYSRLIGAQSYMDFLIPLFDKVQFTDPKIEEKECVNEAIDRMILKGNLEKDIEDEKIDVNAIRQLNERFERTYPHRNLENLVTKTSVSELKKAYLDTEFSESLFKEKPVVPYVPSFISEKSEEISGTDRGTAYHKVMELLEFNNSKIESQFNNWVEKQLISKEQLAAVPKTKITKFLEGNLAQRMAKAEALGLLWKEQPFVLGISADVIDNQYPDNETVLLQGIIDAFFIEDDKIVLVDYKTDVIENGQALIDRYFVQVRYYKEALERIFGKGVKECILYSFYLGEEVRV